MASVTKLSPFIPEEKRETTPSLSRGKEKDTSSRLHGRRYSLDSADLSRSFSIPFTPSSLRGESSSQAQMAHRPGSSLFSEKVLSLDSSGSPQLSPKSSAFSLPISAKSDSLSTNTPSKTSGNSPITSPAPAAAQLLDGSTVRKIVHFAFIAFAAISLTALVFFPPVSTIYVLAWLFLYYGAIGGLIFAPPIYDSSAPLPAANNLINQTEKKDENKQKKNDLNSPPGSDNSSKESDSGKELKDVARLANELVAANEKKSEPSENGLGPHSNSSSKDSSQKESLSDADQDNPQSPVGFGEMLLGGIGSLVGQVTGAVKRSGDDLGDYQSLSSEDSEADLSEDDEGIVEERSIAGRASEYVVDGMRAIGNGMLDKGRHAKKYVDDRIQSGLVPAFKRAQNRILNLISSEESEEEKRSLLSDAVSESDGYNSEAESLIPPTRQAPFYPSNSDSEGHDVTFSSIAQDSSSSLSEDDEEFSDGEGVKRIHELKPVPLVEPDLIDFSNKIPVEDQSAKKSNGRFPFSNPFNRAQTFTGAIQTMQLIPDNPDDKDVRLDQATRLDGFY